MRRSTAGEMDMRRTHSTFTITCVALAAIGLSGCGGSGSSGNGGSASTAPVKTSTTGTTTPGSTTPPPAPVTPPTNPPPAPAPLTEALVTSWQLEEVVEVDSATGAINNTWATGDGPTDVANGLLHSYVTNAISQDITVIDRLANNVVATIDVSAGPISGIPLAGGLIDPLLRPLVRPTGVAVTPNGNKLFSANLINLTAIDATTLQPTKSYLGLNQLSLSSLISNPGQAFSNFMSAPVRGVGMAKVAATNDYAMATCMITGTVMRVDARTDSLVGYTDVGNAPIGITIANGKAYVACAISQEVYVVDVATGNVLTTLAAGMIPVDVSHNQAEDRVYVANAVSGDITVIDTSVDLVIDTLPAGMAVSQIFQQLGVQLPSGSGSGVSGMLNGFLQGFVSGINNPASFGALVTGGSGSILSPASLINALITGFLGLAGVNQSMLSGLNLPALGIMSVSVAHDPDLVCAANALMGEMAVTRVSSRNVNGITGLTGLGPADVAAIWRR